MHTKILRIFMVSLIGLLFLTACDAAAPPSQGIKVVATTTIVGDVVRNIGGDRIDLTVLLPTGSDPHSFEPTPQDVAKIAGAQVIFANGAGLEAFLGPLLTNAGSQAPVIAVSDGITLLPAMQAEAGNQAVETPIPAGSGALAGDPHTWFDPMNVKVWVKNITQELTRLDSSHAQEFQANAAQYDQKLDELDTWIKSQVAQIPADQRKLVTDHSAFTYFANRYGFTQVGAIVPGYSTLAQPSAQELANLEDAIRALQVKAVFVGDTVNPNLAERVAQDTGTRLVFLYTGSLTNANGPAPTYLDFMRYDVTQIVTGLK